MASKNKKNKVKDNTIATNNRARFDYEILDTYEAGIQLVGTEVKALRNGAVKLDDAHAQECSNGIEIVNLYIPEYTKAGPRNQHSTKRARKLLLHKREINKILGSIAKQGMTAVPLKMYFNDKGLAKMLLGLGKGKKDFDKRAVIKEREWNISKNRILKDYNN